MTFQVGDAEALPVPDAAFDAVVSIFGVMFTPDQERAAAELLRVCTPGGTIGLANWTPDGFLGEFFRTMARYVPPPPGVKPPVLWGTEERLPELFGDGVVSLQATPRSFINRYRSPGHFLEFFRTNYGPTLKAFEALDTAGQETLARDIKDLVRRFNRADDGTMVWSQDYLEVVVTRR